MSFQTANDEGYSTYYGKGKFDVYKSVRAPILDGINVLLVTFKICALLIFVQLFQNIAYITNTGYMLSLF